MENYTDFAKVYDLFMQSTPYEQWVNNIEAIWKKQGLEPKLVLDLGCGTGTVAHRLAKKGYEMIGVDASADMLSVAREKNGDILYLNQDMREFELYGTVDAVISLCDTMNYLLEEQDLLQTFKLVANYMHAGGIFVFDVNTLYKYKEILAENQFSELTEEAAYIWENFYDDDEQINEYTTCFFVKDESGKYDRFEELHLQRAYKFETVKEILEEANLELLEILDVDTLEKPKENSERVYFICRSRKKVGE